MTIVLTETTNMSGIQAFRQFCTYLCPFLLHEPFCDLTPSQNYTTHHVQYNCELFLSTSIVGAICAPEQFAHLSDLLRNLVVKFFFLRQQELVKSLRYMYAQVTNT